MTKLLFGLASLITIAFLVMAYYIPDYGFEYEIICYIILLIGFSIVFGTNLANFFEKEVKVVTYEDLVQQKAKPLLDELNHTTYLKRNMQWYLLPGHYWLELRMNVHEKRHVQASGEALMVDETDRPLRMDTDAPLRIATNEDFKQQDGESTGRKKMDEEEDVSYLLLSGFILSPYIAKYQNRGFRST